MSSKTIICIHGLGASRASFSPLARTRLASKSVLKAVDLPGFGARCDESVPDDPLSAAAQELADEINAIGSHNVILVGHSLGGAVALVAAKMAKADVFAVASIEGNLIAEDCGLSRRIAMATTVAEREAIRAEAIADAGQSHNTDVRDWASDLSRVSAATLFKYSKQLVDLSDSGELLEQFISDGYRKIYLYGDEYSGHPILNRLGSIPTQYVAGAGHISFIGDAPEANALALSSLLPDPL
jgi:pimeloyl-ACP methyl ester carboxylesterase